MSYDSGFVFIGGCPRSGTTLVQRILGANSTVFAGPEFDFIPKGILKLRSEMLQSIAAGRINKIVEPKTLDRAFRAFIGEIATAKLKQTGKTTFCEKTPASALVFAELAQVIPEAKFIFVVRDPRRIVNSMKGVRDRYLAQGVRPPRFVRSVAASVGQVNRYFDAGFDAAREDSRILVAYYENIVADPEREARRICAHIGIPYENSMTRLDMPDEISPDQSGSEWYTADQMSRPIAGSGVVTSGMMLTDRDLRLVENRIHKHPELVRYNLSEWPPSLGDRFAWSASWLGRYGLLMPRKRR